MAGSGKNMLAILSGRGSLPEQLCAAARADGREVVIVRFGGQDLPWLGNNRLIEAEFECLGAMFEALAQAGVGAVVLAGAMKRPNLNPSRFDAGTLALLPRLIPHLGKGDDALMREIAEVFSEKGFIVEVPQDILTELLAGEGILGGVAPTEADLTDAHRAATIVDEIGRLDIGQGAVVAQGLSLALESLPGTDRMLEFVQANAQGLRPDPDGAKGVLFKGPKPGQDLRVDMPAIGPLTVENAARAGLAGIAVRAGKVLVLERENTIGTADRLGLFLYGLPEARG